MYNHDDHHVHNDEVSMMINMLRTQPTARPPHIQVRMATVPRMVPASPSAGLIFLVLMCSHGSHMVLIGPHIVWPLATVPHMVRPHHLQVYQVALMVLRFSYGPHMALPWVSYGPHVVSHEDFTISLSCSPNHGLT